MTEHQQLNLVDALNMKHGLGLDVADLRANPEKWRRMRRDLRDLRKARKASAR